MFLKYQKRDISLIAALGMAATASARDKKPNVVLMVRDNLGWGEIDCYGAGILRGAPIPRLDQLAS